MPLQPADVLQDVADYYTQKILRFGPTALGVDWSCIPTQEMRFVQLLKVCDFSGDVSLNDLGCGYGALLAHLAHRHRHARIDYLGQDLSAEMITQAVDLWKSRRKTSFAVGHCLPRCADYSVASGIFNVKLGHSRPRWEAHVRSTLVGLHDKSSRGYAVNFLAPVRVRGPRELYRTPVLPWVRFCEQELGAQVEVLDDYGMREFTLLASQTPNSRRVT